MSSNVTLQAANFGAPKELWGCARPWGGSGIAKVTFRKMPPRNAANKAPRMGYRGTLWYGTFRKMPPHNAANKAPRMPMSYRGTLWYGEGTVLRMLLGHGGTLWYC